jgi:hypothetical protein
MRAYFVTISQIAADRVDEQSFSTEHPSGDCDHLRRIGTSAQEFGRGQQLEVMPSRLFSPRARLRHRFGRFGVVFLV